MTGTKPGERRSQHDESNVRSNPGQPPELVAAVLDGIFDAVLDHSPEKPDAASVRSMARQIAGALLGGEPNHETNAQADSNGAEERPRLVDAAGGVPQIGRAHV